MWAAPVCKAAKWRAMPWSQLLSGRMSGALVPSMHLRRIRDASVESLDSFIRETVYAGSLVHSDSWEGFAVIENQGYRPEVSVLGGKRRLLMTHHGAVRNE